VPACPRWKPWHLGRPPRPLLNFYERYGFKGLAQSLGGAENVPWPASLSKGQRSKPKHGHGWLGTDDVCRRARCSGASVRELKYDTVLDLGRVRHLAGPHEQAAELVALDTETTSLDAMRAEIVGISFSVTPGEAAYIPLAHAGPDAPEQLPLDEVLAKLKPWLENPATQAGPAHQVRPPRVRQPRH
jgi:DNA polymerase I